jgi:hypothetical protein
VGVLFLLSFLLAGLLVLLVVLAPLVDLEEEALPGWMEQVLALFARDAVVRRISLAGAIGLAATASVFFRPTRRRERPSLGRVRRSRRTPPPRTMAGA